MMPRIGSPSLNDVDKGLIRIGVIPSPLAYPSASTSNALQELVGYRMPYNDISNVIVGSSIRPETVTSAASQSSVGEA